MPKMDLLTTLETQSAAVIPFPEFLMLLHATQYTGPVTFHCFNGVATSAELAADPVKIRLTHGQPARLALDTVK